MLENVLSLKFESDIARVIEFVASVRLKVLNQCGVEQEWRPIGFL
jgi:hypothetical protein